MPVKLTETWCPACNRMIPVAGDGDHIVTEIRPGEFSLDTCQYTTRMRPESLESRFAKLEADMGDIKRKLPPGVNTLTPQG